MYYRFDCGKFFEAESFEHAKAKFIQSIRAELEDVHSWHACTCLGFDHRHGCPEKLKEGIPF